MTGKQFYFLVREEVGSVDPKEMIQEVGNLQARALGWEEKSQVFCFVFWERWNRQCSNIWVVCSEAGFPGGHRQETLKNFKRLSEVLPHTLLLPFLLLLLPLSLPTSFSSLPPHFAFFKNPKLCLTFFSISLSSQGLFSGLQIVIKHSMPRRAPSDSVLFISWVEQNLTNFGPWKEHALGSQMHSVFV